VALAGGAGFRYYEITAGLYDAKKNEFLADAGMYAMGFVLTSRDADTQAVATFYNRAGEVLSVQTAAGMRDPANASPPEGTRGRTTHWKTGFYYIALEAGVPIVLAYMDYARKVSGLGPVFVPTGDVDADMAEIKRFYAGVKGRRPQHFEAG
jgi:hypothetical protein